MQDLVFYVAAGATLGVVRDYANARNCAAPTFVRGVKACLKMRLFANNDTPDPYPIDQLEAISGWEWAMDCDFSDSTALKLAGDNRHISVASVTETIDDTEYTFSEITIPMPEMNTAELLTWLGSAKSKNGLHGELVGYGPTGAQVFVLQVENFTVRNRITSAGMPTEISPDYMTVPQIEALFTASMEVQLSADGENWDNADPQAGIESLQHYRWYRFRNSAVGNRWSSPVPLLIGPRGYAGTIEIGNVTRGEDPSITNTGTSHDAIFDVVLPKGDKGDAATIQFGSISTSAPGTDARVVNSGDEHNAILDFTLPHGVQGEKGDKGDAASITIGRTFTGETGTLASVTNTGTRYDAVLNFTIPRGEKGEKGDSSNISIGTVTTLPAGSKATVSNSGTSMNPILNFRLPKGDTGAATYLYVAWAYNASGVGFSLEPSPDRKYRAELRLQHQKESLSAGDFAGCEWVKAIGDDGVSFGEISVGDELTTVPSVTSIVFENATVRTDEAGKAIVSFSEAGIPADVTFITLNALRKTANTLISGGGSPGGNAGLTIIMGGFNGRDVQIGSEDSVWATREE